MSEEREQYDATALVRALQAQPQDEQQREDAIAGLRVVPQSVIEMIAEDYAEMRWVGDLGGVEL